MASTIGDSMARENVGQILIDAGLVQDVAGLRTMLASGIVKQNGRTLEDGNEKIDTAAGALTVGDSLVIGNWLDHSLN